MKLTGRDRRALLILLLVLAVIGFRWGLAAFSSSRAQVIAPASSKERLLTILADRRKAAAAIPQKKEVLQRLTADLALREGGLILADTAPQAQAQLLQTLKNAASEGQPPLELKQIELPAPRLFSDAYGEVAVSASIQCGIDELLNLVAELTANPQIIATDDISLATANQNLKTLQVRLTVTGLVHRTLITKPHNLPT
jgi:Tfp pilus assembly protein PilO